MRLDGKALAEKICLNLKKRIEKLKEKHVIPHLTVILIGENPASVAYVAGKQRMGESVNAKVTILKYNENVSNEEIVEKIKELNDDPGVHGILIQRPVPEHIKIEEIELLTDPIKDIDGFHPESPFTLPLPLAVVKILEEIYTLSNPSIPSNSSTPSNSFLSWLKSTKIAIIGKGPTGGGPVIKYLKSLGVNPQIIDSKTNNPEEITKSADIIVSSAGRKNMVRPEMLKKGVILISVGIFRDENNKLSGDYNPNEIENIASFYTPTPGGVGPVNVAMLIDNLVTAAEQQSKML